MQRHIDDAVSKGAQVLLGGKRLPGVGSFFAPTVPLDVPADALVNKEETFGPLAALTRFETEEVIRLANNAPVRLAGYFFSRDAGRVWRVAEALEVGMVEDPRQCTQMYDPIFQNPAFFVRWIRLVSSLNSSGFDQPSDVPLKFVRIPRIRPF